MWIAIDATCEAAPRTVWRWCGIIVLLVLTPFQVGLTDGPASRLAAWSDAGGLRGTLLLFGLWPAVAAAGVCVDVILPRRHRGDMEPLLASPASSREIVLGHALPVLLVSLAAPLVTFPAARLGYRVLAPHPLPAAGWEFLRACLATWGAGTWMAAALVHASLKARDSASLAGRVFVMGCLPLLPFDLTCALAGMAGWRQAAPAVIAGAGVAGLIALERVTRRLDREALLRRS